MNDLRPTIALLVAPFVAPAMTILLQMIGSGMDWPNSNSSVLWILGFSTAFGFFGLIVAGLPITYALNRWGRLNLVTLTLAGAVGGVLVFALSLVVLGMLLDSEAGFGLSAFLYGALIGAAVASTFGIVAGMENLKNE